MASPKCNQHAKVAIVGLAALYPDAKNATQFWQNLLDQQDSRTTLTNKKLGANLMDYRGLKGQSDRFYCDKGGYIENFHFDATGYKIPADKLTGLDDSFLWALDTSRKALLDAGIDMDSPLLSRTGIIMGALSFPTAKSNALFLPLYHSVVEKALQTKLASNEFRLHPFDQEQSPQHEIDHTNGAIAHSASKVLADALGLGGVQLSLDAACASSVYSLKLACDYLSTGKADLMIAGAVSGADPFFINMGFSIFHAYPEHGVSSPFDRHSQGLFAGEGSGTLILKRLEDAEQDGDKIYAVVNSVGLSNDGKGQFVLSPNSKGQINAFERAYAAADIDAKDVEVIECHATGTPLGDKVELTSMEQFFAPRLEGTDAPLIGSTKSNLGHLLTAAGMPGIMKMIFAMQQKQLPANININQAIESPNGLFGRHTLVDKVRPWPVKNGNSRRLAGVSVFGFGGCNAHLLLESAPIEPPVSTQKSTPAKGNITQVSSPAFAISGVACHFGPLDSINAFDNSLIAKDNAFIDLPASRWKGLDKHPELLAKLGVNSIPKGAYIDGFDLDFLRFKLPPNEDDRLIAQQLLLMKVADEAIRDANLQSGQNVAVLVAMETELELHQFRGRVNLHTQLQQSLDNMQVNLGDDEYQELETLIMDSVLDAAKLNQYTSFIGNIMASRIAALWDFSGPAFTVSAAEQSVSRAFDIAENLLKQGDLDAVVVAAVDLAGSIERVSLKAAASGDDPNWKVGEGAGALVLQTTNDVSHSYGAIESLGFGRAPTLNHTIDKLLGQTDQLPDTITLIEQNVAPNSNIDDHGNIRQSITDAQYSRCDSHLGHSFAASGMASVIHALLRLNQQPAIIDKTQALVVNISDNQHSLVHITQTQAQQTALTLRLKQVLATENKLSLIKKVTLGGRDIYDHIIDAKLDGFDKIKNQLAHRQQSLDAKLSASTIQAQTNPVHVNPIWTNKVNDSAPQQMKSTTMQPPKNNPPVSPLSAGSIATLQQHQSLLQQTHLAFLNSSETSLKVVDALLRQQLSATNTPTSTIASSNDAIESLAPDHANVPYYQPPIPESKSCIWDYKDLVEYAEGDIAKVFGDDYAVIDSYSRRVRLPTTDYLLVSRVTKLDATINQYRPSSMTTEYDIPLDAPYLVDGQIPWAVAVESGQCDLMLISYLGIDFENKGDRIYRLLDCTLTFLGDLPRGGDTLRYDISIDNFARNGETLLFFFSYRCYVGDTMILKMDGGCAGFFTDAELADGKGVIHTDADIKARRLAVKKRFHPPLDCQQTQFDYAAIYRLLSADISGCFGSSHQGKNQPSLCFASEKFLMIERVSKVDRHGGSWGLGLIEGHKQLEPDHWYFPCHFKGDQVMAGSLMAEGCGQLLQFYMLYLGLHTHTKNGRFQPLKDASQQVRCRGQVIPQSSQLSYRMEVTEIGFNPHPYAKANIDIIVNGKVVVDFQNLGVTIKEDPLCTRYNHRAKNAAAPMIASNDDHQSASANAPLMAKIPDLQAAANKGVIPLTHVEAPIIPDYPNRQPDTLPFTPYHLFEFATGDIENCFGADFNIYRGMIPPRTPCGDLQLTTRVIAVDGTRGDFKQPCSCIAEYEVPTNAWYFSDNSHPTLMPYSILMEIALQPNGFISGYIGTTLKFAGQELFFRNLDGHGTLLHPIDLRGKTIVNESKLLSTVMAGSNIIQSFSFTLSVDQVVFYEGGAVFGYFKAKALKDQLGLDKGIVTKPWHLQNNRRADISVNLRDKSVRHFNPPIDKPFYRLPKGQLNLIDSIEIVDNGGTEGLDYLYAQRKIDPSDWFFQFHFHQDPVMPGSLGVEAIIETLQSYAISKKLGDGFKNPKFNQILSDIKWKYRGQITPLNQQMSIGVDITSVSDIDGRKIIKANASLSKDGLRIYQVTDIAIAIEEA